MTSALIDSARAALLNGDWNAAARSARRSLQHGETAEGHELLGLASWWLSDADTLFTSRERAYRPVPIAPGRAAMVTTSLVHAAADDNKPTPTSCTMVV